MLLRERQELALRWTHSEHTETGLPARSNRSPSWTEECVLAATGEQARVQLGDEPFRLILVDHKGEVEVAGGLAQQVNALLLKQAQDGTQLME